MQLQLVLHRSFCTKDALDLFHGRQGQCCFPILHASVSATVLTHSTLFQLTLFCKLTSIPLAVSSASTVPEYPFILALMRAVDPF